MGKLGALVKVGIYKLREGRAHQSPLYLSFFFSSEQIDVIYWLKLCIHYVFIIPIFMPCISLERIMFNLFD